MSFNTMGSLLAVSSAHDTVHIFKLGPRQGPGSNTGTKKDRPSSPMESVDSRDPEDGRTGDYDSFVDERKKNNSVSSVIRRRSMHLTKSLSSSVGGYLPNTLTEIWEPARDFAFLRLPTSGARCVVGLSGTLPHVMVISSEGYFYAYNIDLENGGECTLMRQYSLVDADPSGMD